ncbi:MAG: T9SS type A sorting domain-containing protein [Bacteroidales bacterium]|nr:T9SS type A sorting domain-containing protein [Bacteroidales bacterium]
MNIKSASIILALLGFFYPQISFAQKNPKEITEGTLTFTVRTISNSTGYSPKHVLSIWIKDEAGNFIVSRKVMAASRKKHLVKWVASSAYNTTSATTGATLNTHQTHTITWDGRNADGALVEDGIYQVWVEYTSVNSANGQPAGPSTSIPFHKGPVTDHITPANLTYFQDMILDWVPLGVGVKESPAVNPDIVIYPNPFAENTNIKFSLDVKSQVQACIFNFEGRKQKSAINEICQPGTYSFEWDGTDENGKRLKAGIYLLQLTINGKSFYRKLILR